MEKARAALHAAECEYLKATGWVELDIDLWLSPYKPLQKYLHGHAVNSQKWHEANGYSGYRRLEPQRPEAITRVIRLKPWIHPICATMAEYRNEVPNTQTPEEQLAQLEVQVRYLWPMRKEPRHRKALNKYIRSIRTGWKPIPGRMLP